MTRYPPRLATGLLRVMCRNEALVGDLMEEFQRGRSATWYRRQVVIAILASNVVSLRRLIAIALSVALGFLIALAFIGPILEFTLRPLLEATPSLSYLEPANERGLYAQVAALAGFVLATPVIFYHVWLFAAAGPSTGRRWAAVRFACVGSSLFIAGAAMSHFVFFPWVWSILTHAMADDAVALIRLQPAFLFYAELLLVCGLLCPMPTSALLLARVGAIAPDLLSRNFGYASALLVTVAAVVTPTPDVITLAVAAVPLLAVYSLSAFLTRISGRARSGA